MRLRIFKSNGDLKQFVWGIIGGVIGYLIGAVQPPVSLFWFTTNPLQETIFWANIKEISVLIGGIVAVFTYFRNGRSRKQDVAYKKFDRTIEAETYFHHELSKQIQQLTAQYQDLLVHKQYYEQPNNMIRTSILKDVAVMVDFGACLKGLNVLASYTYYDTFNKLQFYSSTADEIDLLASIEGFDTIQLIFDETHRMNNYKTIINDALQYLNDVDEGREKYARNETLHRSRH